MLTVPGVMVSTPLKKWPKPVWKRGYEYLGTGPITPKTAAYAGGLFCG